MSRAAAVVVDPVVVVDATVAVLATVVVVIDVVVEVVVGAAVDETSVACSVVEQATISSSRATTFIRIRIP
jgi:hypothetical protein